MGKAVEAVLEAEIEGWFEDIPDELAEAFLELVEVRKGEIEMTIGEEEAVFTIAFSQEYPKASDFVVSTEDDTLNQWVHGVKEAIARKPNMKMGDLLQEMGEQWTTLQGRDDDDEMEGIDLRASQGGFDSIVGGALAKEARRKAEELARVAMGDGKTVGFLDYDESACLVRAAVDVSYLDPVTAKVWGINPNKVIVLELKFHLEDDKKPPAFSLYQSSDPNLEAAKMKDISSFGLEWQLRARLDDWLNGDKESKNKPNWPPKDQNFIAKIIDQVVLRVNNCTKTCIICDGELPFQMIKPAVCSKSLCVHSHEQYGLGADVASEIRDSPDVIDLLISFCYGISQGDHRRFNPYPLGVEAKYAEEVDGRRKESTAHFMLENRKDKNLPEVKRVLDRIPKVSDLMKLQDTRSLANYLDNLDPLAFPLLRWIITSNRAHLAKLEKDQMITEMNTPHQYMFLSSPPEKEAKFQELKRSKGSFWAFHGSNFANWHSILRIGLKNYSNTDMMSCGAAYGAGIYLAPQSGTSMGYAHAASGWPGSNFKGGSLICLCLCEVINEGYKANPHFVIPNEDHVMTRYFFIYSGSTNSVNVEAAKLKNLRSSPLALEKKSSSFFKKLTA